MKKLIMLIVIVSIIATSISLVKMGKSHVSSSGILIKIKLEKNFA